MRFAGSLTGRKRLIAMIHVDALPGTPGNIKSPKEIISSALNEAHIYKEEGIDCVAIENMHDVPYLNRNIGPEITSMMAITGNEIKIKLELECGIQILAGANKEALACAHSAGLDFIRTEGFIFAHIADEGMMNSDAGELMRYRKNIGAENVSVFTDIKKKHSSHSITSDTSISETAKAAQFFLSDGVIVSGVGTGQPADLEDVKSVKDVVEIPVIIGSGLTDNNISKYYAFADAFIVGSFLKENGAWSGKIDKGRVQSIVKNFMRLSA
jgi:hypothetical protein